MHRTCSIALLAACLAVAVAGCGGRATTLIKVKTESAAQSPVSVSEGIGFPVLATKNTTRVSGADPAADAAGVALAVFPSTVAGTHPTAVTIAPTDDWEAAIASSVLMAAPIRAPILLSGSTALPPASADALNLLKPTGAGSIDGAQVIRIGNVPTVRGLRPASIQGSDPYVLAAAIDRFASAAAGNKPSPDVVIASTSDPAYAMPAAGWAAESGDPILFVSSSGVPPATAQALIAHQKPHIYVLGPPSVVPDSVLTQLRKYGTVARVGAQDPAANSVAFAV